MQDEMNKRKKDDEIKNDEDFDNFFDFITEQTRQRLEKSREMRDNRKKYDDETVEGDVEWTEADDGNLDAALEALREQWKAELNLNGYE